MDMTPVQRFLERHIGLDVAATGVDTVALAVERRLAVAGVADPAAYAVRLAADPAEAQALCEAVAVHESWFFRDEVPFRFLQQLVKDAAGARRPLRLLSCPCARGEEPYSMVISLLAAGLAPEHVEVLAADLTGHVLTAARQGVYKDGVFRGEWAAGLARQYCRPIPGGFHEVLPVVRDRVRFARGNLLDPAFAAGEPPFDMVFCRNLLIYLTSAARQTVFTALERLLAPGGWLFVGHAEMGLALGARFLPGPEPAAFACRRPPAGGAAGAGPAAAAPRPVVPAYRHPPVRPPVPAAPPPKPPAPLEAAAEAAAVRELADQGDLVTAAARCQRWLQRQPGSAEAHYLMGVLHAARSQWTAAEAELTQAVALDGTHGDAMLHLAVILERRGERADAVRLRQRLRRQDDAQGQGSATL
ncbi:MAG: protein-glutamate O-methyltransferase CheR [Lentisphaeria bacterium]